MGSVDDCSDNAVFELKKGRHDPCLGVRAGITLESRMAIELANAVFEYLKIFHNRKRRH